MNRYEAMFIIKPELSEDERKVLFNQIQEAITKNNGKVSLADIWSEKKRLYFPIKRHQEGVYYLASFVLPAEAVAKIREAYHINENILRVMISRLK